MKFISKETKTFKVFNALYHGEKLTASDASKRFGLRTWPLKLAVSVKTVTLFTASHARQAMVFR